MAFTAFPLVEMFVEFESPQQLRDTAGAVVVATLLDARPGSPLGRDIAIEPATIHVDFEVTSVLGGVSEPYRSPEVDNPRAITVVLPIQVPDVEAARREIAALAGATYLLFLGQELTPEGDGWKVQPLYKLWPAPVVVLVLGDDGKFWPPTGVSVEAYADAIERGRAIDPNSNDVVDPTAGLAPVDPLADDLVGKTQAEIEDVLKGIPGRRITDVPAGVTPVEQPDYETIAD